MDYSWELLELGSDLNTEGKILIDNDYRSKVFLGMAIGLSR